MFVAKNYFHTIMHMWRVAAAVTMCYHATGFTGLFLLPQCTYPAPLYYIMRLNTAANRRVDNKANTTGQPKKMRNGPLTGFSVVGYLK